MTKQERIARAKVALEAYKNCVPDEAANPEIEDEVWITDLLGDLAHLAESLDMDPDHTFQIGLDYYESDDQEEA